MDFDGDWISNNNWENQPSGDLTAYVYYSVMETETHWFLYGADKANTPWGYNQAIGKELRRGDWFLDPARALAYHATIAGGFSTRYLYNPYLADLGLLSHQFVQLFGAPHIENEGAVLLLAGQQFVARLARPGLHVRRRAGVGGDHLQHLTDLNLLDRL